MTSDVQLMANAEPPREGSRPLYVRPEGVEVSDPLAANFFEASGLPLAGVALGLFDQSDDCIKLVDLAGRLQFMNCNGRQAMEIDDMSVVSGCSWEEMWPLESRFFVQEALARAKSGALTRFEAFCPTAKGTPKWWEVTVSPVRNEDGSVAAILSSSRDVTERKHNEDALAAVADEMKHRLRNAYTVSAAVSLVMAKAEPQHKAFANELANRLARLSEVQTSLVDASDIKLADLIAKVLRAFEGNQEVIIGQMPDVRLAEKPARALALVLGELATNSLKHGSLAGRGSVAVDASIDEGQLKLLWRETHLGSDRTLETPKSSGGAGQQIMTRILASVGGHISAEPTAAGYGATVTMRL